MRGADYFPRHPDWAREYNQRHIRWQRDVRGRDWVTNPTTGVEFDFLYTRMLPEFENWRLANDVIDNAREDAANRLWQNIPELDVPNLTEKVFDRPKLRPFKLQYDTLDEVRMRFKGTCILIKGNPFFVSDLRKKDDKFHLLVEDHLDAKTTVRLDHIDDFRSAPPGYVQLETDNLYMTRVPARVNQQGLNNTNTTLRRISTGKALAFNAKSLVQAIETKGRVLLWADNYRALIENRIIPELRLSDEVAMFTKRTDTVYVGYKGRMFGKLDEGNVVKADDEDDLIQPWVKKHFDKVNLEVMK